MEDGTNEGKDEIDGAGTLKAEDEYHECREEDSEVDWAERRIYEAEADVEQAQEGLAALMDNYDESEEAQIAVCEQTACLAERNLTMPEAKKQMNSTAKSRGFQGDIDGDLQASAGRFPKRKGNSNKSPRPGSPSFASSGMKRSAEDEQSMPDANKHNSR